MNAAICMTIAGSDSGGGAGIQADLKTFTLLGVFGTSVLTALTAQNTREVRSIHAVPPDFLRDQLEAVLDDLPCASAKTGMLANAAIVRTVTEFVRAGRIPRLVVDPVMVATSGARLLENDAADALQELITLAEVFTPNLPEAEILLGKTIPSEALDEAAQALAEKFGTRVLLKGGHLSPGSPEVRDILASPDGFVEYRSPRLAGEPFHGTGCTLSAAIAASLAKGIELQTAVEVARDFLARMLEQSRQFGGGATPVAVLAR